MDEKLIAIIAAGGVSLVGLIIWIVKRLFKHIEQGQKDMKDLTEKGQKDMKELTEKGNTAINNNTIVLGEIKKMIKTK